MSCAWLPFYHNICKPINKYELDPGQSQLLFINGWTTITGTIQFHFDTPPEFLDHWNMPVILCEFYNSYNLPTPNVKIWRHEINKFLKISCDLILIFGIVHHKHFNVFYFLIWHWWTQFIRGLKVEHLLNLAYTCLHSIVT